MTLYFCFARRQAMPTNANRCGLHVGEWHRYSTSEAAENSQGTVGEGAASYQVAYIIIVLHFCKQVKPLLLKIPCYWVSTGSL